MRITFTNTLLTRAKKDKRIILLTGDLGFSIFETYMSSLPHQFLNAGVAEQNMTGVAAGLAMEDRIPIIFSIIPFVTMRNFEQIRNDICHQNLNVKIVGVGAGFTYPTYQHTHNALEDIGILRTLPNLVILCPGDPLEAKLATRAALKHKGPVYIRLGKAGEPQIHKASIKFKIGKGIQITNGNDITLFATSTLLLRGQEVTRKLKKYNLNTRLISMHTIKPLDTDIVKKAIKETPAIFTLEEHSIIGGLGSAVAECIAEYGKPIIFKRLGVPDTFSSVIGQRTYMQKVHGLDVQSLVAIIRSVLKIKHVKYQT